MWSSAYDYGLFWGWQGQSKGSRFMIHRWSGPGGPPHPWADGAPQPLFLLCFCNKITLYTIPPTSMMCPKLTKSPGISPPDSPDRYGCVRTPQTHPMPPNTVLSYDSGVLCTPDNHYTIPQRSAGTVFYGLYSVQHSCCELLEP